MGFKCGIVGLPNVGKSTLFNALTRTAAAQAANYPFSTIEPNTGEVAVPDPRLDAIATIVKPAQIVPTRIGFVDIAGLVRGASKGEGLGNQFLANIREVDAIVHVVRCFEGTDITHVEGRVDPVADAETVNTELMLADLASLERRVQPLRKRAADRRQGGKGRGRADGCRSGASSPPARPARLADVPQGRGARVQRAEPDDREAGPLRRQRRGGRGGDRQPPFASASRRSPDRKAPAPSPSPPRSRPRSPSFPTRSEHEFLASLGLTEPGLDRLIRAGYDLLGLITYFTAGPKEVRAWTIPRGTKAPQAAGVIHTRFRARLHPRPDHRL